MWKNGPLVSGHLIVVEQMVTMTMEKIMYLHCVEESHQFYVRQNIFVPIQFVLSDIWTAKKIQKRSQMWIFPIHKFALCKTTGCIKSGKGTQYCLEIVPWLRLGPWACGNAQLPLNLFCNPHLSADLLKYNLWSSFITSFCHSYYFTSQLSASFKWHFDALEEGRVSEPWNKL